MKIRFETTIDDLIEFNLYHVQNSSAYRFQRLLNAFSAPVVFVISGSMFFGLNLLANNHQGPMEFMITIAVVCIVVLIGSIAGFYFVRWHWLKSVKKAVLKQASVNSRLILGWSEMELVGNYLNSRSELIVSSLDLRAIIKIDRNDDYGFIYITTQSAYIIPLHDAECSQFVDELHDACENYNMTAITDTRITEKKR